MKGYIFAKYIRGVMDGNMANRAELRRLIRAIRRDANRWVAGKLSERKGTLNWLILETDTDVFRFLLR